MPKTGSKRENELVAGSTGTMTCNEGLSPSVSLQPARQRPVDKNFANRARHRLCSLQFDVERFLEPILLPSASTVLFGNAVLSQCPIVANARCGTWYAIPLLAKQQQLHHSCYFKSTDGHVHAFSLKRLNLPLIELLASRNKEMSVSCVVVLDASVRKQLPDSLSRTIPIWAATMNRIVCRYRRERGLPQTDPWDNALHTPRDWVISTEEHEQMESVIDDRVEELYRSGAIVNVDWLINTLTKPLRPYWMTPSRQFDTSQIDTTSHFALVCCNCSVQQSPRVWWNETSTGQGFWYTPGAADDEEAWSRGMTPCMFWKHAETLPVTFEECGDGDNNEDDAVDVWMDSIVSKYRRTELDSSPDPFTDLLQRENPGSHKPFNTLGNTSISIGTRRSGRPPYCWHYFDAILNVTDMEYLDIHQSTLDPDATNKRFYLQLPVKEGKRDHSELEQWMAVGIVFCIFHAQQHRRVLIHCAQGKDRSVAVAMAVLALFARSKYPLDWCDGFLGCNIATLLNSFSHEGAESDPHQQLYYQSTGLPNACIEGLLGSQGRDHLLRWVQGIDPFMLRDETRAAPPRLVTKDSLQVTLHLIRQDREVADPTRSTMQKLNRFFMSGSHDPKCAVTVKQRVE